MVVAVDLARGNRANRAPPSLLDDLHTDDQRANLVQGIINLSESLNLDVIAEGIEQPQQADQLRAMRSALGQGFLLSRPIHPDAVLALLRQRNAVAGDGAAPWRALS